MFSKLYQYGRLANSHDGIKAIAITLMVIDHLGLFFFPNLVWLRLLGRGAAPLFFFATGFVSKHRFRYDLIFYGLLLTALTYARTDQLLINILINFTIIKLVLTYLAPNKLSSRQLLSLFVLLIAVHLFSMGYLEYGSFGLLFAIGARLLAEQQRSAMPWLGCTTILYVINEILVFNWLNQPAMTIGLAIIGVLLFSLFYAYREVRFSIPVFNNIILFLGRYSLEIYFWHLVLFNGIFIIISLFSQR